MLILLLASLALLLLLVLLALLILLLSSLALLLLLCILPLLILLLTGLSLLLLLVILALLVLLLASLTLLLLVLLRTLLPLLRRIWLPLLLLLLTLLIAHRLRCGGPHIPVGRKGPIYGHIGRASMVLVRKLSPVSAGGTFILHLRRHGRRMRLSQSIQFRGSRSHPDAAGSAIETYANAVSRLPANRTVVSVVCIGAVEVVD